MRKTYAFLLGLFTLVACSDSNPTSSFENSQLSKTSTADFGEGYTFAIPIKYDEATGLILQGTYTCNYHPDTKTFAWEENPESLEQGTYRIVGDSLWMGPAKMQTSDDRNEQMFLDAYHNVETLALSNNHDGIYGVWNVTGCERKLGEINIKCTKYIGHLSGIARTLNITKDTVYNTTVVDFNNLVMNDVNLEAILDDDFGFDIRNTNQLVDSQIIKIYPIQNYKQSFSIGNQMFEEAASFKFDSTGMKYITTMSSNGITCTRTKHTGMITEKMCKEESAEFLLSGRDKSEEEFYYEEGPIESFGLDNRDEYRECTKSLPTEETKQILSQYVVKTSY